MALIPSHRHSARDLAHWREVSACDEEIGTLAERKAPAAIAAIQGFVERHPRCYVGVSWGKDSVVVAHLALRAGVDVPLVWVCVRGVDNPDCPLVRDAFTERFPSCRYDQIEVDYLHRPGKLTSSMGFELAAIRHGNAYVSGVRGDESSQRKMRMRKWGVESAHTLAPIGFWGGLDVFGYLALHDLPIHPAYACTFGGTLNRERVRVAAIGGERGTGVGRREWERHYYSDDLLARPATDHAVDAVQS